MIFLFDNFINVLETSSTFKKSVLTYNLIMALMSYLNPDFSMKTYRVVHDSIWPIIAKIISSFILLARSSDT